MGQFDRQIETALRLIKKNGQSVEWKKPVVSVDPTKPWLVETDIETVSNPVICFLPLDLQGKEFLHTLGFTDVMTGSFYGLMGKVEFEPLPTDYVIRDGVSLDIAAIDLLSPNGQKILYTIIFNG